MAFDKEILLSLKRQFTGQEKYRLFLKYLDDTETALRNERQKHTELMQNNAALKKEFKALQEKVKKLELTIAEYTTGGEEKKFVRMSTYRKLDRSKSMFEQRFWEVHKELQQLKSEHGKVDLP